MCVVNNVYYIQSFTVTFATHIKRLAGRYLIYQLVLSWIHELRRLPKWSDTLWYQVVWTTVTLLSGSCVPHTYTSVCYCCCSCRYKKEKIWPYVRHYPHWALLAAGIAKNTVQILFWCTSVSRPQYLAEMYLSVWERRLQVPLLRGSWISGRAQHQNLDIRPHEFCNLWSNEQEQITADPAGTIIIHKIIQHRSRNCFNGHVYN